MLDEQEAVLSENRRLRREARELGERIAALERSRWWRLHPRFLFRRRGHRTASRSEPEIQTLAASADPVPDDTMAIAFREEAVTRGDFDDDWFTPKLPALEQLVRALEGSAAQILEIGSYEGLSTCYFLWRLPDASVTCVDTFPSSDAKSHLQGGQRTLEATFDHNVELVDASRVRKLVGDSRRILLDLVEQGDRFTLVYVDGSHAALDVVVDAAFSWRLLEKSGLLIFDDYTWNDMGDDLLLRPGGAIDAMLGLVEGKYELLHKGAQLAVRKTA